MRRRTQSAFSQLFFVMTIRSPLSFFLRLHTSSKPWRESPIILKENYNGEHVKTFRLYVAGYEGVYGRGCCWG